MSERAECPMCGREMAAPAAKRHIQAKHGATREEAEAAVGVPRKEQVAGSVTQRTYELLLAEARRKNTSISAVVAGTIRKAFEEAHQGGTRDSATG
jgi:hypothetical protein